jgi:hypothetical protein
MKINTSLEERLHSVVPNSEMPSLRQSENVRALMSKKVTRGAVLAVLLAIQLAGFGECVSLKAQNSEAARCSLTRSHTF